MSTGRARKKKRPREHAPAPAAAAPQRPARFEVRDGIPRPDAIWAPFPLTEIGMATGIVMATIGFAASGARGPWLLAIGLVVLAVVVAELCLREHFAGFRSHSILLGLLPVTIVHMAVVAVVTDEWRGPLALAVDLAVAGGLASLLHARFRVAREQARAQQRQRDSSTS